MRQTWTWHFDLPPQRLWPLLADTNRLNEAMGLPAHRLDEIPQANNIVRRLGKGRVAGFALDWEEEPWEWIRDRRYRHVRVFSRGPFRRFGSTLDIDGGESGGSTVSYTLEWEPLTLVGRLSGAALAERAGRAVGRRIVEAAAYVGGERRTPFDLAAPELPEGAPARAAALAEEIDRSPYGNGLGRRLCDYMLTAMMSDLTPVRPKRLAQTFGVAERTAIEACLAAVKAGLLAMKWDLLCTNCRGAKFTAALLSELPRGAHCPACNIDYSRDFERNVELSFTPVPAIRPAVDGAYCLNGPMSTPHVPVQILLAPGERRIVGVVLPPGRYRLRTLHPGGAVDIDHMGGAFPGLRATGDRVEALPPGDVGTVTFVNEADFDLAALIEDRTWARDALTAPEVISLQAFRDLFAEATLRPGDEAGVGQVTLLFSDLRGSTALYERVGDGAAYNIVRRHFELLARIVRDHNGGVVKTIGDAVMASFGDPADAFRAAVAMQAGIGDHDLVLKLGIHAGPSVVVNLNDRLDYFGSTVNMAARLQGQSEGGDIVVSRPVAHDPAVKPLLAAHATREENVTLKGFATPVGFVRVLAQVPK